MSSSLQDQANWEAGTLGFLQRQLFRYPTPVPKSVDLRRQTGIVTGANVGLGFEALRQLLQLGLSRGILAVRNQGKGDAAANILRKEFPNAQIDVMILDLASYQSIRSFVKNCEALQRLDIVILNAGMQTVRFEQNKQTGHEVTLQINYLSTMLLSALLLPVLKAKKQPGQPSRLSVVSSDTSYWSKLRPVGPLLLTFNKEENFDMMGTYSSTKLMLTAGIKKLAEYINSEDVIVNTVNPGLCTGTDLSRELTGFPITLLLPAFVRLFGRGVKSGASTYINGAVVQGKESHGSYCSDWTIKP